MNPPLSLDALEKAAKDAEVDEGYPWFGTVIRPTQQWTIMETDARFIAAASPDTLLALVAVVRAAQDVSKWNDTSVLTTDPRETDEIFDALTSALAPFKEER